MEMVVFNSNFSIIDNLQGVSGVKLHRKFQSLFDRFRISTKLGQGTYGNVFLAENTETGEEVAIKAIKKGKISSNQELISIQREIQIMSLIHHPHIIHMYEVFENKDQIVLVMEYACGGELFDYLSKKDILSESEARHLFRQIASAVFYLHKNKICHRDLKLENILVDDKGNAKLTDFGLSNVFDENHFLSTFCGSPLYVSPEMLLRTVYFGPEVDCWSLGVLLFIFVYGCMPFDGTEFRTLVKQISQAIYHEPENKSNASLLIRRMLSVPLAKRATIDEICSDEWIDLGENVPLLNYAQDLCHKLPIDRQLINLSSKSKDAIVSESDTIKLLIEDASNECTPVETNAAKELDTGSGATCSYEVWESNSENMNQIQVFVDKNSGVVIEEITENLELENCSSGTLQLQYCHENVNTLPIDSSDAAGGCSSEISDLQGYYESANTESSYSSRSSSTLKYCTGAPIITNDTLTNSGNVKFSIAAVNKTTSNLLRLSNDFDNVQDSVTKVTQSGILPIKFDDPLVSWGNLENENHCEVNKISSVMDTLEDPCEVLKKAMELCSNINEF